MVGDISKAEQIYSNIRESETPIRIFEYKPTKAGYNPELFLKGFEEKVITDGYNGYNNLPGVTNVYCWAHARRKVRDAIPLDVKDVNSTLAKQGLDKLGELFKIESKIDKYTPEEKVKACQEEAKPILEEFFVWCEKHQDEVLSKAKISQAFSYALNHRKGLSEYLNDGLLPITNSLDERVIRPFEVGYKNWLFSASPKGVDASAAVYSIIETAKANGLDPYKYLYSIFNFLPSQDLINELKKIDMFLPWSEQCQKKCK